MTIRKLLLPVIALLSGIVFAQEPTPMTQERKDNVLKSMDEVITKRAYVPGVDFSKWPELVKKHQKALDEAKDEGSFTTVMNQALQEFGFSHIVLFSPQAATARTNRKTVGLGVRIQPEPKGLRIVYVFPGTPADVAGIHSGDLIVAGDGKSIKSTSDLQGDEGSKVKVTVEREGKKLDFDIVRKSFSTDIPESLKWVDKETAMVTIPTFDLGYKQYKVAEIMNEALGAKNLILDLRGNGGGQVLNLLHLANFFFDPKVELGTFVNRQMVDKFSSETKSKSTNPVEIAKWSTEKIHTSRERGTYFSGKVVVLINGGTGSASEMMAAALKERKGARVIGTKSAGAVLASLMMPISEKYLLQFPVMDYVTIEGLRLEGNGVKPDDKVDGPAPGKADKAIELAQKWFANAK